MGSIDMMVVNSVLSALTRLPAVSSVRLILPVKGAVIRVKSRFNWACSTCARADFNPPMFSACWAKYWSTSC